MSQVEALRLAMLELGDAPAEELAAYMGARYGVRVWPQFIPVLKATLKDKEMLAERRRQAQEATQANDQVAGKVLKTTEEPPVSSEARPMVKP
jgi:hypothetical protein